MPKSQARPLTLNEAAEYAQVHRKTMLKALQRGDCVGYQRGVNCPWRIYRDDLDRYIKGETPAKVRRSA